MDSLSPKGIRAAVQTALAEDLGSGDVTTLSTVPEGTVARARLVARAPLVVAGIAFAEAAFHELDTRMEMERLASDGARLAAGDPLLHLAGAARAILTAERVALNFLQHLSGIATLTARFVQAVDGTGAQIFDTRKTTPGWRVFEKYAVTCGGGRNHRAGLFDQVLIKDNHLAALRGARPNPVEAAVRRARQAYPGLRVEVEADTPGQVEEALRAGADIILLDNMSTEQMRAAVRRARGRAKLEASGGVTLERVRSIAETGVDFISVGALTHSAPAVDIALDFETDPASRDAGGPAPA